MLAGALLLAACDGSSGPEAGPSPPLRPTPTLSETSSPSPGVPPPRPVTIAFAGDVHFEGSLRDRLDDPATALAPVTRTLAAADLAVVNLETSVGEGGRPEPGKRFTFQAPATALTALADGGIDVATMANNHALDFGRKALASTFAAIGAAAGAEPPLTVVGIGRDATEAFRPARSEVGHTVVATIGATMAATDPTADPTGHWAAGPTSSGTADAVHPHRLLRAVARANGEADVVVVYVHWGIQGEACPTGRQRSLARALVAAGADVVVGSHAHRLQGDGRLGDGYVAFGLGNYVWYAPTTRTGVLTVTVRPAASRTGHATVTAAQWAPARIGADGLPRPVHGAAADGFRAERRELRACAGLS